MLISNSDIFPAQCRATLNAAIWERDQVTNRLQAIEEEKKTLQQQLQKLILTIIALQPLCEADINAEQTPQLGVLCYNTLLNLQRPATAPELRLLIAPFMNLGRYPNPLAMIHMALKRMSGVACFKQGGKVFYQVTPRSGSWET